MRTQWVLMKRSGTIHRVMTAALVCVGLAACGPASSTQSAGEVPDLLQFTAPLVGGGEFVGADYVGRATAFWFWAPT